MPSRHMPPRKSSTAKGRRPAATSAFTPKSLDFSANFQGSNSGVGASATYACWEYAPPKAISAPLKRCPPNHPAAIGAAATASTRSNRPSTGQTSACAAKRTASASGAPTITANAWPRTATTPRACARVRKNGVRRIRNTPGSTGRSVRRPSRGIGSNRNGATSGGG